LSLSKTLPTKGTYTLMISLNTKSRLKINKFGFLDLQKGYYAYTGSALGNGATSLRMRVKRHLKKRKIKHWHIDFLLANKNAKVASVVAAECIVNKECQVNNSIKNIEGATVPVVGFGASDCKQHCASHLIFVGEENPKEKIMETYRNLFRHSRSVKSVSEILYQSAR